MTRAAEAVAILRRGLTDNRAWSTAMEEAIAVLERPDAEVQALCDAILSASDYDLDRYQSERDEFICRARELAKQMTA